MTLIQFLDDNDTYKIVKDTRMTPCKLKASLISGMNKNLNAKAADEQMSKDMFKMANYKNLSLEDSLIRLRNDLETGNVPSNKYSGIQLSLKALVFMFDLIEKYHEKKLKININQDMEGPPVIIDFDPAKHLNKEHEMYRLYLGKKNEKPIYNVAELSCEDIRHRCVDGKIAFSTLANEAGKPLLYKMEVDFLNGVIAMMEKKLGLDKGRVNEV